MNTTEPENSEIPRKPGRPKGSITKITRDVRALTQELFSPIVWSRYQRELEDGTLAPQLQTVLLAYAFGKPVERVEVSNVTALPTPVLVERLRAALATIPEAERVSLPALPDDTDEDV